MPLEFFPQSLRLSAKIANRGNGSACECLWPVRIGRQRRLPGQKDQACGCSCQRSQHVTTYLEFSEKDVIFSLLLERRGVVRPPPYKAMKFMRNNYRMVPVILATFLTSMATDSQGKLEGVERQLSFYHTHTRKRLDVVYSRDGVYDPLALDQINRLLFDFRTGDKAEIDPQLLDLIYEVREALGSDGTYQVISAYRSPKTNEMLRGRSANTGVAKKSQHLMGKAIDVRLEGVKTKTLRDAALAMKRGGVGFYEASDFVHMDTGRPRSW